MRSASIEQRERELRDAIPFGLRTQTARDDLFSAHRQIVLAVGSLGRGRKNRRIKRYWNFFVPRSK